MTTHDINCTHSTHRTGFAAFFTDLRLWLAVRRQRRALAKLDDAGLDDIGISRAEADAEAKKVAWDVPQHWVR